MKKLLLLNFAATLSLSSMAQSENTTPKESNDDQIFTICEKRPEFPGGLSALQEYLVAHTNYPAKAKQNNIQGTVLVNFVVEKDGSITNVTVEFGTHKLLDKEAIRVVKSMPKWSPGESNGRKVRAYFTLPFNFQLE